MKQCISAIVPLCGLAFVASVFAQETSLGGTLFRKNQVLGLAGLDWTPSGGWTITAQYVADGIIDYESDLERKDFEHQATLSIEKSILNETFTITASGAIPRLQQCHIQRKNVFLRQIPYATDRQTTFFLNSGLINKTMV